MPVLGQLHSKVAHTVIFFRSYCLILNKSRKHSHSRANCDVATLVHSFITVRNWPLPNAFLLYHQSVTQKYHLHLTRETAVFVLQHSSVLLEEKIFFELFARTDTCLA